MSSGAARWRPEKPHTARRRLTVDSPAPRNRLARLGNPRELQTSRCNRQARIILLRKLVSQPSPRRLHRSDHSFLISMLSVIPATTLCASSPCPPRLLPVWPMIHGPLMIKGPTQSMDRHFISEGTIMGIADCRAHSDPQHDSSRGA